MSFPVLPPVAAADDAAAATALALLDRLTKPPGSLGRLEDLAVRLAAMAGCCPPDVPEPAAVAVFAGDHGVHAEGVTPWPQEVTAQMVANFCAGGAAINVLARQTGARVVVVDIGVATPLPEGLDDPSPAGAGGAAAGQRPRLIRARVADGTANLATGPAMTAGQAGRAVTVGLEVAAELIGAGARLLVTGDMGIANTTPSAALIAAFTGRPAADVTGRGTGIDDASLTRKVAVIRQALERVGPTVAAPSAGPAGPERAWSLLAELGGLEIAGLAGFIIGGAAAGVPVVIDGVIAAAALLVADGLTGGAVRPFAIAGHRSVEPGASAALAHLDLEPLLDLGLRLGEGTGACLAVPVVQAAARLLGEMATFDSAGVTEK